MRLPPAHGQGPRRGDAEAIAAVTAAGFESYRARAGSGWQPPPEPIGSIEVIASGLVPQVWAAVAEEGREGRGVVAFRELLTGRR